MTQPDSETGDEVARIKAIQDNAERLGLTWGLRPATVTSNADPVMARYDGDGETIAMVSMIGVLNVGQRVYAIRVPPSGNYIVGAVAAPFVCRLRDVAVPAIASGAQTTLTWDTVDEMTGGIFATVPDTTITIPETGIWAVTYDTAIQTSSGTRNFIAINPTTAVTGQPTIYRSSWGPGEGLDHVAFVAPFMINDTFTATVFQNSGGPLNLTFASLFLTKLANWVPV